MINAENKYLFILFFLLVLCLQSRAQLNADFTIDKQGGCSPLTVQFTNATTGASKTANYKWDFGNGNNSGLLDPGATYTQEKAYTVTLTVTDGGASSVKQHIVTVYKKPSVDFSLSPNSGCVPLNVSFTSSANPGDGTVSNYFWDFGDGQTQSGSTYGQIPHTYTFEQKPVVSLTVTNSYGCYTTALKNNIITVSAGATADFAVDKTVLCQTNNQVQFTNNSTGAGTLTYTWDFGDGTTSAAKSPAHTYTAKGTYTVTLTTNSTAGCTVNAVKANLVNVANFAVDFIPPALLCTNSQSNFTDISTAGYNSTAWSLDGQDIYNYPNAANIYTFNIADTATHSLKLTHTYGTCTVNKAQTIKAAQSPQFYGIVENITTNCQFPEAGTLSDTTKGIVKWEWFDQYPNTIVPFATGQTVNYSFPSAGFYQIGLRVTNNAGCFAQSWHSVNLETPDIRIISQNLAGGWFSSGCKDLKLKFTATPADVIKTYSWNFGDGSALSTDSTPVHKFTIAGTFRVVLTYLTVGGCTGTVNYTDITIIDKSNFDFTVSPDTVVCGNTVTTFTPSQTGANWYFNWFFGDNTVSYSTQSQVTHQYYNDSTYTVTMVAQNSGCFDTVIKKNYIRVKPDFPKISSQLNTCDGTRGAVKFTEASTDVTKWAWDFGDGTTKTYTGRLDTVTHFYTQSGAYKTVLTGINGSCSVRDSVTTRVLLKQSPLLSSPQQIICGSDSLNITINNLDVNPASYIYSFYYITGMQYGDSTQVPNAYYDATFYSNSYTGQVTGLNSGQKDLRVIIESSAFHCYDTTNFIQLKIKGPKAGFKFGNNSVCLKDAVTMIDASAGGPNLPIKKWEWNFGDGTSVTQNNGGTVSHVYPYPGQFAVKLTVTDTGGCYNTTPWGNNAICSGPMADFAISPNPAAPNTLVNFYNNTSSYNAYNINYTWIFPNGSKSNNNDASYTFGNVGSYSIKLVSTNADNHCTDTAVHTVVIKKINTAFTYALSYINNNSCPPVIAKFTSTSANAVKINWDFGDGSQADNQRFVSHTYTNPGIYRVVLYGIDVFNNVDSTDDYIEVKGPYAILSANRLTGCDSLIVTLSAAIKNASSFTWDFGDGTLKQTTDTFSVHQYSTPGVYTPQLILKDSGGCSGTSTLPHIIIIDSLTAAVTISSTVVCDSELVYFHPVTTSIAHDQLLKPLHYHWNFGTVNAGDTSNQVKAAFRYEGTGKYNVTLNVSSPYGCTQTVSSPVNVQPVSKAGIAGLTDICENSSTSFAGSATNFNDTLNWHWVLFNNGTGADGPFQNTGPVYYSGADSGITNVTLIINNNGCYDTAYHTLHVHATPRLAITPALPKICLGGSIQLQAHDAVTYSWQPNSNINNISLASPTVSPAASTYYYVTAANASSCVTYDSVLVTVIQPFKLKANPGLKICIGSTGQLSVSGASTYKWITGTGLSDTLIPNPIITTSTNQAYTVVGYDSDGCFTDTAVINATITARPTVTASPHAVTINAGTDVQVMATGSADVVRYAWTPADYLQCAACAITTSSPKMPVVYTITATNQYGCTANDTVRVNLVCAESLIYIPTAFTPNGDGRNDRFILSGNGIKLVKHIAIFARQGEKVFERSNIQSNDVANSWDGTLNGIQSAGGAYVFMAEIECVTGETYKYKGTITLIR